MSNGEIKLVINKEIHAPVESVFAAWTQPELMKRWFAPGPVMQVRKAESELKVGGRYLIHMHDPDTEQDHIVSGKYKEIVENKKLVFDWAWQDGVETTLVSLEFRAINDDQTMLTLTHTGFSKQEFADKHNYGWNGCLENLEKYSNTSQ